eukprot:gene16086-33779_t
MMVGALVLPVVSCGMTEASTTRRPARGSGLPGLWAGLWGEGQPGPPRQAILPGLSPEPGRLRVSTPEGPQD